MCLSVHVCFGGLSINKYGGGGVMHEGWTQSNSTETGAWAHISPE